MLPAKMSDEWTLVSEEGSKVGGAPRSEGKEVGTECASGGTEGEVEGNNPVW